ncbi:MAG TPA: DUF2079 domain-containing protein, partial [Candidatus Baltobacteraceae bacterium]|nr:DUF2079 domain-containing protein [Candidatus Baltobacteraceae bacterium]
PGGTHFRTHWSPILALLWPLIRMTHSPLSLQIAQVVLIALTAVPLYRLIERYAGTACALRCAWLCLLYPPLLANAFAEFHELAFYPVLTLSLIWAADRARWGWFAVFAALLVLVREDACLDLAIIGIALALVGASARQKSARGLLYGEPIQPLALAAAGTSLTLLAAGSLAFYAGVVLTRLGPWAPSHFYQYAFARGPLQTALSIFTHPVDLLRAVATRGRLTYLLEAFVPLALLPLLTPWTLLALPAFAGILLSSDQSVWRMGMHYVLLWAPWMVLAASFALVRLAQRRSERIARIWWRAAISLCVVFLIAFNPMHPAHYLRAEPYQHSADVMRAFACVPRDAEVVTHDEWFAHEAIAYPNSSEIPDRLGSYRGYIVYGSDWQSGHFLKVKPQIEAGVRAGTLLPVCRFGSVAVVRTR